MLVLTVAAAEAAIVSRSWWSISATRGSMRLRTST